MESVNFNSPHVVFLGADGKIAFAQKSSNFHEGLRVLAECSNFQEAVKFAESWEEAEIINDEIKGAALKWVSENHGDGRGFVAGANWAIARMKFSQSK